MNKKLNIFLPLLALFIGFSFGRISLSHDEGREDGSPLRLHVLTKAHEMQNAIDALSFLSQGNSIDAKILLESQIKSSLIVVKAVGPNSALTPEEAARIKQTVSEGEAYAKEHNL
jgi:hypothetical protein